MYLKDIKINGFKSFADKIDIKLDNDISCIVGPNGSGKSNVVDAVRWVLGEQSVKSLRGTSSMQDVIFSGSKTRNPLNTASVELIFDNTDHFLNIPYTEVSIKRRIFRSGENEYFLNNESCRLKDITNLLLDTSIGKESFNIISQGEVDRILSNSSMERRTIIEEAAGVLKYKKRKEEALRKLEKTHNNMNRVNDIINELENRLVPLEEQKEKALIYLDNKEGLDKYEVALTSYDIENYNYELKTNSEKKEKLEKQLVEASSINNNDEVKIISKNNELDTLQRKYNDIQQELIKVSSKVEELNGKKILLSEQQANNNKTDIEKKLLKSIDKKSKLEEELKLKENNIKSIEEELSKIQEDHNNIDIELNNLKKYKSSLDIEYNKLDKELISIHNKIASLKEEIESGGDYPLPVKEVLRNNSLDGIINTISNVIDIDEKYLVALNIASYSNRNFIITRDDECAKKAIKYLKDNHLGRATFFPLNVIKERYVDSNSLDIIKDNPNFIGVLSDLLSYNKKYENIIKNQFGNILLCKDLNSANDIAHQINNKYRIITLDGDQINVGGSLTGGSLKTNRTLISAKQELSNYQNRLSIINDEKDKLDKDISNINDKINNQSNKIFDIYKEESIYKEKLNIENKSIEELTKNITNEESNLENLNSISNNKVDSKEKELIEEYNKENSNKERLNNELEKFSKDISKVKDEIEELEINNKETSNNVKRLEKEKNEIELEINKINIKIDNLLEVLSEYELTFEKAYRDYKLDISPEEARNKIKVYKRNIKEIGMVNIDAIEEYEEVNSRYSNLMIQKEDLEKAETTLIEIMQEMDEVMKEEFSKTFENINQEFKKVFKELFKGGTASLELTNPESILETGVDIVASPPGKKLTTINLLSGGEKTLIAISLLFAILNVKTVPFCLFDEVEAALDEANVLEFGNYLKHYKGNTQFLIITHKKKTMEYAKTLYGITMQESGVSKLVSVTLEDHK